ncbi:MAG TPA: hypothetical protein VJJ21_03860 [Candidatus Nanoarchaeia archaeon]|nr:hypothetical protein [Candidatus Nanoarchaeia archaeon]
MPINPNQELVQMITRIDNRLERIELGVQELKEEIGLEVRPEYLKKLKKIQKQKGTPFKNIAELRKIIEG